MSALAPYFVRKILERLPLTESYREHADKLLALCDADSRINVQKIHQHLFPLSTPASANSALNRLLTLINDSAEKQGVPLQAKVTQNKKAGAAQRWVWFEGLIEAPSPAYTGELNAIPADRLITDQRGLPADDAPVVVLLTFNEHETAAVIQRFCGEKPPKTETRDGITYNLLGEHGDMSIVHRVSKQGEGEAQNAAHDAIRAWQPRAIIGIGIAFGVNPKKQHIGDVLVSENVRGYELGRMNSDGSLTLRSDKSPASPTLYQRFNHLDQTCRADPASCLDWPTLRFGALLSGNKLVDNLDYRDSLLKLETEAIGGEMEAVGIQSASDRHKVDWIIVKAICDWGDGNKNANSKARDQKMAADHAALVVQRTLALGRLYPDASADARAPQPAPRPAQGLPPPPVRRMNLRDRDTIAAERLISDSLGYPATLRKAGEPGVGDEQQGVDVMQYLLHWITDHNAPPLFALLGEYGMGKTVTCQRLAEHLETQRRTDPTLPLPLYFDLRHVTGLDKRVPTLRETLEECMARGWMDDGGANFQLENIQRWMAQGAAVIIDGLDEVLVKLKEQDGQTFTNGLLSLHAAAQARCRAEGCNTRLRLLISCRTQYFRTLRDQQTHFTGQERGAHQSDAYRALVLLPLNDAQIMRYLAGVLPDSNPEHVLDLLRSVHNLEELAHRPYTLKLVSEFIPAIERERMAGKTVYGVTLYRHMAQSWLERDQGKHHIRPEHKLHLAAHLAAYLWQTGNGLLPAGKIENWFHAWLETQPDLKRRYANLHFDQLDEDLRTATFLARQDGEDGSSFRFAHTSLLEFFLADYLLQAVRDNEPTRWALKRPSIETLDFLGQMLAESAAPKLVQTLQGWRTCYRPLCSELLLAYAQHAGQEGWPTPLLRGIDLAGADLQEWVFEGAPGGALLDLSTADFSGANLRAARFDHVRLEQANFSEARLAQANFLNCEAGESDWRGSDCTATIWRETRLTQAQWHGAAGYRPQFLLCGDAPDSALQAGLDFQSPLWAPLAVPESNSVLRWLGLANSPVFSCAFSPDGAHVLSGGADGALHLWDARCGAALLSLSGHQGGVHCCAFSPDGARLLSGGDDGLLRLWDARSGAALLSLSGHQGGIRSCAFSPDGARLLSGGDDGVLCLWDAHSGEVLLSLNGHQGEIGSCAFSPDCARLLSGGDDGLLRLWDARSGAALLNLSGHPGWIGSCAFSPDGARVLSGGTDGLLRLWDARSGATLLSLSGHPGWIGSCAFSPDGARVLSGGDDGLLRLWDTRSGAALLSLSVHRGRIHCCTFSPNRTRLLSGGSDGLLRLWDARSGTALLNLSGHQGGIQNCVFSPDGACLLSGGDDGLLRLWDACSGAALLSLSGHQGRISCAFSPDGARLLSGGHDGLLRLWDARSGAALLSLSGHQG
ncbi:MAG: pentapeptide repeat-containing protein, partial [Sulfuricellaceae bacterium]